jgi:hypothetical protein
MRNILLLGVCGVVLLLGQSSCEYETIAIPPLSDCDTLDIRYSTDIVPILDQHCYVCHSGADPIGGFVIDSYDELTIYVDDLDADTRGGLLLCSMEHTGCRPMPEDQAKLPPCTIKKVEVWIRNGAQND